MERLHHKYLLKNVRFCIPQIDDGPIRVEPAKGDPHASLPDLEGFASTFHSRKTQEDDKMIIANLHVRIFLY